MQGGSGGLEEEAKYADQPACGLSPRLVVRRGCETLTAMDPPSEAGPSTDGHPPTLKRVDTVSTFERAVGRIGTDDASLTSPATAAAPPLTRVETMSGLPEVAEAFDAVGEDARPEAEPRPVRRVDTMELLLGGDDDADTRASKRQRALA